VLRVSATRNTAFTPIINTSCNAKLEAITSRRRTACGAAEMRTDCLADEAQEGELRVLMLRHGRGKSSGGKCVHVQALKTKSSLRSPRGSMCVTLAHGTSESDLRQ
jgi:hypothetical protein